MWALKRGHSLSYVGLFLFTLVLYFRPMDYGLGGAQYALWIAVFTLAAFVPTQFALEGTLTARPREVNLILLLSLLALLSMPLAVSRAEAWSGFTDKFSKVVLMFIVMVNVVRTERRLKALWFILLAAGLTASLSAFNAYRSGNLTVGGYRVQGAGSNLLGNPNDMALYLVTVMPIAVALFLGTRAPHKKVAYAVCTILFVVAIVVTYSRGGFLGLIATMAVMAWKIGRRNRLQVTLASIVVIAAFLAFVPGNYGLRVASIFIPSLDPVGSSGARQNLLTTSVNVALHNPLLGVGMENFHFMGAHEQVSHNSYTQVASELGLPALIVYIMFMVTPLRRLRQVERETFAQGRASPYHDLAIGLQASLVGYMVCSFFASVAYLWYVYYLVGFSVCLRRMYEAETAVSQEHALAAHGDETPNREAEGDTRPEDFRNWEAAGAR
jgi:probable O-glycosylation ligase (exosortase A-associated)